MAYFYTGPGRPELEGQQTDRKSNEETHTKKKALSGTQARVALEVEVVIFAFFSEIKILSGGTSSK